MALRDGGKYLSTEVVITILVAIASVFVTFFTTRAGLESRISKLEAKLPIADYLTARTLTHNVNELSYLRNQIIELEAQVRSITVPKLEFAKGVPAELGGFVASPWQANQEWVSNLPDPSGALRPLEVEKLSKLLDGDAASSLRSEDTFLRLQSFIQLANEYDRALGQLVYVYGSPTTQTFVLYPTLRRGASRQSAEPLVARVTELAPQMKESIANLQPRIDDEIHSAREALEKAK